MNEFERNCLNYLIDRIDDCPQETFDDMYDMISCCFIRDKQKGMLTDTENEALDWCIEFWGYLGSEYDYYLSETDESRLCNPFSDTTYFMIDIVIQVCTNYIIYHLPRSSSWKNFKLTEDKIAKIKELILK